MATKKIKTKKSIKNPSKTKKSSKTVPENKRSGMYILGNLLIFISVLITIVVFYPVVTSYLFPPSVKSQEILSGNYITIPKIHAQAPLIFNVDPNNQSIYDKALKQGVAQAKGTYLPGENGRSFLFAHSSGNPIEQTRYNTIFVRLGELKIGDDIFIKRDNKIYKYKVTTTKIVSANETKYLEKDSTPGIIIQTCWPIGTSYKRLLVFASPVEKYY